MFTDCCMYHFGRGENVCPVCMSQVHEDRRELEQARQFRANRSDLHPAAEELIRRKALTASEVGRPPQTSRLTLERNPNRRAVYRMLGIYLPEREARTLLQNVHDYKWIEAEKAGFDLWSTEEPRSPLSLAAHAWARHYLQQFLAWRKLEVTWSPAQPCM